MKDYLNVNRESWNQKVPVHLDSEFYRNKEFIAGRSSLNDIEINLLEDVNNKSILHLQCHFGQDSISLNRLGAKVVGIDFSDRAIETARNLAIETGSSAKFICSDVYDLPNNLDEKFDIVYATYGTIGWLPDIDKWAEVVTHYLKPGGSLIFVEFHPVIWMFDNDFKEISYTYFQKEDIVETSLGTYADQSSSIELKTITWNHGLAEVIGALLDKSMRIDVFQEFNYSPYDCFHGTIEAEPGKFRIERMGDKLPMVYSIKASLVVD